MTTPAPKPNPGMFAKRKPASPTPPPVGQQTAPRPGPPRTPDSAPRTHTDDQNASATAPYTAVRFPTRGPLLARDTLHLDRDVGPSDFAVHDRLMPGRCHGWIEVTATLLTPAFCATTDDSTQPAHVLDAAGRTRWILPDTTITGMLRNTVRQITGSRLPVIDAPALYIRHPFKGQDDDPAPLQQTKTKLQQTYARNHGWPLPPPGDMAAAVGILESDGHGNIQVRVTTHRAPKAWMADVLPWYAYDIGHELAPLPRPTAGSDEATEAQRFRPNVHPTGQALQGFHVAYCVDRYDNVIGLGFITDATPAAAEQARADAEGVAKAKQGTARLGRLYLTGITGVERTRIYVIPDPAEDAVTITVPSDLLAWLNDPAQITRFQRDNFPPNGRIDPGQLAAGLFQPVWFRYEPANPNGRSLRDKLIAGNRTAKIISMGRATGYRVPAHLESSRAPRTVLAGMPANLRHHAQSDATEQELAGWQPDAVQALFGATDLPASFKIGQITRRVRCSTLVSGPDIGLENSRDVTLLEPHPSAFLHYLDQPNLSDAGDGVITWSGPAGEVHVRGYKAYLHRGTIAETASSPDTSRSIRPVPAQTQFRGRITFINLTKLELGLLLTALDLDNPPGGGTDTTDPLSAHKIGLGRPLGYGSVHLTTRLHLIDPTARYRKPPQPTTIPDPANTRQYLALARETLYRQGNGYRDALAAAQWRDKLSDDRTLTMPLQSQGDHVGFDQRQALPPITQLWEDWSPVHGRPPS